MAKRTLLCLNFFPTFTPPQSGGEQRSFYLLRELAKTFDVHSVVPTYEGVRDEIVCLAPDLTEARFTQTKEYRQVSLYIRRSGSPIHRTAMTYALAAPAHTALVRHLHSMWQRADGVLLQHPSCFGLLNHFQDQPKPLFYLSHNCEFELAINAHRGTADHRFAQLMFQLEQQCCLGAAAVFATTGEDCRKFQHLYGVAPERLQVCGNGSANRFGEDATPPAPSSARSALFLGSKWGPNVEAARTIVETLAPTLPDFTFHLVGGVCGEIPVEKAGPNVILHFQLTDPQLTEILRNVHFGLNPVREGTGSNVKVADYLAHGLRVVTTAKGARGFEASYANLHVVELAEMADQMSHLAVEHGSPSPQQRAEWQRASRAHWSWEELGKRVTATIAEALRGTGQRARNRTQLLVLNEFPVRGFESGGEARIAGLWSWVEEGVTVTLATFGRDSFRIHCLADHVACVELPATHAQLEQPSGEGACVHAAAADICLPAAVDRNPAFLTVVEAMAAQCDGIVVEHPFMWPVLERLETRLPLVFGSHEFETRLKRQALDSHPSKHELLTLVERSERRLTERAELVLASSEEDARHYLSWGAKAAAVVENGVAPAASARADAVDSGRDGCRVFWAADFSVSNVTDVAVAVERLLGRAPDPALLEAATASYSRAGTHALLATIVGSRANLQGRRSFVLGLNPPGGAPWFAAVFLGTSAGPNLTAAETIVNLLAPACPEVSFLILGRAVESLSLKHLPDNVFPIGFVSGPEKTRILQTSQLALNPVTDGRGSNLKIPEYLEHGLPVLSTYHGAQGLEVDDSQGLHRTSLLRFPEMIRRLCDALPPRQNASGGGCLERYHWPSLSSRYFSHIRGAALTTTREYLLVVEDVGALRAEEYSPYAETIRTMTGGAGFEVATLSARDPVTEPLTLPLAEGTVTRVFRRDFAEHQPITGIPQHGMYSETAGPRLDVSPHDLEVARSRRPESVLFGGGWSLPLWNGEAPLRVLDQQATLHLPPGVAKVEIRGRVGAPMVLQLVAEGTVLGWATAQGGTPFELRADVACRSQVGIRTRSLTPVQSREHYVAVDYLAVQRDNAWERISISASPGLPEVSPCVDTSVHEGAAVARLLAPAHRLIPVALASYLGRVAPAKKRVYVIGTEEFVRAVRNVCEAHGADGDRVWNLDASPASRLHDCLSRHVPDWELSLLASARARTAYGDRHHWGVRPLTVLALRPQSQVVHLARALREKLDVRYADRKLVMVVPETLARTAAGRELLQSSQQSGALLITPQSEREALALLAESGLSLAVAPEPWHLTQLRRLRRRFNLNIYFWGAGLPSWPEGCDAELLFEANEVLHEYWRVDARREPMENWDLIGAIATEELRSHILELLGISSSPATGSPQ